MRIALGLEYDGQSFRGWQSQREGVTVQDTLERALSQIAAEPVRVDGETPAFWCHSSGTSGKPKAVIHGHRFAHSVERVSRERIGITAANDPGRLSLRLFKRRGGALDAPLELDLARPAPPPHAVAGTPPSAAAARSLPVAAVA